MALRAFTVITKRAAMRKLLCILSMVPFILYLSLSGIHPFGGERPHSIQLALVVCGDRSDEALVMLKSSVLFTRTPLVFHIFVETNLRTHLKERLLSWPDRIQKRTQFHFYPIDYVQVNQSVWDKPGRACVFQRLFLPERLPIIDSVLYVDTDVIFLSPVDDIVEHFHRFNSTQMVAMAQDAESAADTYYGRVTKIPFYGKFGLNSGVSLMNLTRMRRVNFMDQLIVYREKYNEKTLLGDQDLWNIYFHFYPERIYVLSCHYNYFHCVYKKRCSQAEQRGAYLVHGYTRSFVNERQPALRALYTVFKQYDFGEDPETHWYAPLQEALREPTVQHTSCGQDSWIFIKTLRDQLHRDATR